MTSVKLLVREELEGDQRRNEGPHKHEIVQGSGKRVTRSTNKQHLSVHIHVPKLTTLGMLKTINDRKWGRNRWEHEERAHGEIRRFSRGSQRNPKKAQEHTTRCDGFFKGVE